MTDLELLLLLPRLPPRVVEAPLEVGEAEGEPVVVLCSTSVTTSSAMRCSTAGSF